MLIFLLLCLPALVSSNQDYDYYYDYPLDDQPDIKTEVVLLNSSFNVICSGETSGGAVVYHKTEAIEVTGTKLSLASNTVTVSDAQFTDSGRWTCLTQGLVQEKDVIVADFNRPSVLVGGELVFNSTEIRLRRDSNVDLTCSLVASGENKIPLGWEGGNQPLTHPTDTYHSQQDGFSYSLVKVSSQVLLTSNINEISCVSDNKQINLKIIEEFRPEFTISRNPEFGVPIMEDMTVSLKCSVESNPASIPVWEHNGVQVQPSSVNQTSGQNTAEIRFDRISVSREGWFECTTQHKFGNFSSVGYFLGVKPKPRVTESDAVTTSSILSDQVLLVETNLGERGCDGDNRIKDVTLPTILPTRKTISVLEGESVSFKIEFCSNPLPDLVIWSGPRTLLSPGSNSSRFRAAELTSIKDGCRAGELVGEDIGSGDAGLYLIIIRNSYHIVEEQMLLEVVERDPVGLAGGEGALGGNPRHAALLCLALFFTNTSKNNYL